MTGSNLQQSTLYWLASYPKSGNTWMRAFIANLCHSGASPVGINDLSTGEMASCREWIDGALDFDIHELSHDEIDQLRPSAYIWLSQNSPQPEYHKIHDAYTHLPDGNPLFPSEATKGIVYIVRNPLDVAVSFAHHCNCSIDQAIERMGNSEFTFAGGTHKPYRQLRQKLLSWSGHVNGWLNVTDIPCLPVKYEEMKIHPLQTFTQVARFLELNDHPDAICTALSHCDFNNLQAQESEKSFREKPMQASAFFRKGIIGDWKKTLNQRQVNQILSDHGEVMTRLGYLDQQGRIVECDELNDNLKKPDKKNSTEQLKSELI